MDDWDSDRYVMNEIPIRLIHLPDMKLVERNDMRKHFKARGLVSPFIAPYHPSFNVNYAILSHRWLDEGELTYDEMKSGKKDGPGYEKLQKFREKAQEHQMEFAWSDTCCIDKNSSTELDESIRSMFRWYKNSSICIVHLAGSETIKDIMNDVWMKRGWTLQELLASNRIKLFNKHWMPMTGDRNDKRWEETEVMKNLSRATTIPYRDLLEFIPGPSRVDERMAWAARRETTRTEDVAYSLMGIFDVSLQIAYGEGRDRAFCRLFEAIMQGGDPSIFNWKGDHAKHHSSQAIPRSPSNFLGLGPILDSPADQRARLEMTMTNNGLQVPLVILPLHITSHSVAGEFSHVSLECPLCPTIKIDVVSDCGFPSRHDLALGIVTYSFRSSKVPRISGREVGFILKRSSCQGSTVCRPSLGDLKIVSPQDPEFTQWRKANEIGLVEVNFPNIPSNSYFYISEEYLETAYL